MTIDKIILTIKQLEKARFCLGKVEIEAEQLRVNDYSEIE